MKHYYPAIFEPTEGVYVITVPDVKGCITQGNGDDMSDCMYMAQDAIGTMLDELDEKDYPKPSKLEDIDISDCLPHSFVQYVTFDREAWYREVNPIKAAREAAGLTIKALADLLEAPYKTVQNWDNGSRKAPKWLQKLVVEKIVAST